MGSEMGSIAALLGLHSANPYDLPSFFVPETPGSAKDRQYGLPTANGDAGRDAACRIAARRAAAHRIAVRRIVPCKAVARRIVAGEVAVGEVVTGRAVVGGAVVGWLRTPLCHGAVCRLINCY